MKVPEDVKERISSNQIFENLFEILEYKTEEEFFRKL